MTVPPRDDQDGSAPPPPPRGREPVFNAIPAGVLIIALPVVLAQLIIWLAPDLGQMIINACVVIRPGAGQLAPLQPLGPFFPFIGHVFVHSGVLHLAMNLAILVSTGRATAAAFGETRSGVIGFLLLFGISAIAGALAQIWVVGDEPLVMAGASTGVSGLIAAAGWVMGGYRGMLRLTLPWIALNLAIGLLDLAMPLPIGWAAHIGGALAGAVLFPILLPIFGPKPSP